MKMRKLSKLGIEVSPFGVGCMRFPMITVDGTEIVDEAVSTPAIRYAIDHGVNYMDTAYVYSGQKNEEALGHALRDGYREKVYIATKLPAWCCNTREDMDRILAESMARLETDYIDFYLVHSLTKDSWKKMLDLGVLGFLDQAKADGRIRYAAFSFHDSYEVFEEILNAYDWDMCQIQFNFMDIHNQAGLKGLKLAGEKGIAVVIMEGLLGGKLAKAPENVQALYDSYSVRRSPVEWAFRWIANFPEVATILSGVKDLEMTRENLEIFDRCDAGVMTEEELELIDRVREAYLSRTKIGCTGCRYCMPCPQLVNISGIFSVWNNRYLYDQPMAGNRQYAKIIEEGHGADACISCGACESACPQHLSIMEALQLADKEMR